MAASEVPPAGKPFIFIDTNIYLTLYGTTRVRELLPALRRAQPEVFIPRQVVAEVERNKLGVASRFLSDHLNKLAVGAPPDLLTLGMAKQPEEEKRLRSLHQAVNALRDELSELRRERLLEISESRDEISIQLEQVFAQAVMETSDQLTRARERRERGNPPGKPGDPLGDQLSWEQFLDAVRGLRVAWIVTTDSDFGLLDEGLLCTSLRSELFEKGITKVRLFNKLSDALKAWEMAYRPKKAGSQLPSEEKLSEIRREEETAAAERQFLPQWSWQPPRRDDLEKQLAAIEKIYKELSPGFEQRLRELLEVQKHHRNP